MGFKHWLIKEEADRGKQIEKSAMIVQKSTKNGAELSRYAFMKKQKNN